MTNPDAENARLLRSAPAVRFINLEISATGNFSFEYRRSSAKLALVQGLTRRLVLLAIRLSKLLRRECSAYQFAVNKERPPRGGVRAALKLDKGWLGTSRPCPLCRTHSLAER